jgi:hypothetical protein
LKLFFRRATSRSVYSYQALSDLVTHLNSCEAVGENWNLLKTYLVDGRGRLSRISDWLAVASGYMAGPSGCRISEARY